jgi:hypothetical protein
MKKILVVLLALILVTGCGKKSLKEIEDDIKEEPKVQVVDVDSNSRPIAVMINNIKVAQMYQTGLNDAYLVYEIIVEGGITRLMAVYKDANNIQIGTIRSSRHYFLDYALENDAIYTHFGYSEQAKEDIKSLNIDNINGLVDEDFYWRDTSLPVATEHTVYTNMEKLEETIDNKKYRTTTDNDLLLNYSATEVDLSTKEDAIKADSVVIKYSNYQTNEFVYDEVNKNYVRKSNGEVRVDYVTKENFTAKNIITYKVDNYSIDSYGRQNIDNIGSGEGYFISNGYAVKITWEKSSRSAQTVYRYLNGEEIVVNDGNTYIEIQPTGEDIEINSSDE